jgi:hypothetical protein
VKVLVAEPVIAGESVLFRWTQSEPNPYQAKNEFSFRYEGIDLGAFSPLLFYEIFLGLQLKVFGAYRRPVEVIFPRPVPWRSAAYWRAFHDADLVTIAPLADAASYSPWIKGSSRLPRPRKAAVFFGAGRDSTATTCLLSEIFGPEEVLLVQFVIPVRPVPDQTERLERRQDELMLRPARERLGVATRFVWTDYLAQMHVGHYATRPHAEFFTLGALPLLLAWGVSLATFCIEWTAYPAFRNEHGRLRFRSPKSRPEILATQSAHYRRVLGAELRVTNLNMLMSTLTTFRLLQERYPPTLEQIVMCTQGDVGQRWCYRCNNCAWYALYCLHFGVLDLRFDYDRLFRDAPYFRKVAAYAATGVELSHFGNAPPPPSLGLEVFSVFFHVVAGVDVRLVADRLGAEAYANLMVMKALFGNRTYPSTAMMPTKAIDLLGHPAARQIAALVSQHAAAADDLPGPFANADAVYDFGLRMPVRKELSCPGD